MIKIKFVKDVIVDLLPFGKGKIIRINDLIEKIRNSSSTTEKKELARLLKKENLRFVPLTAKLLKYQTLILESTEDTDFWVNEYLKARDSLNEVREFYKFLNKFNFNHTKIEPHI